MRQHHDDTPGHRASESREPETLTASERLEVELSTLLDGELDHESLLETIDRLLEEPDGQAFYRRARALGGLVDALEGTPRQEAPAQVWSRIATAVGARAAGTSTWRQRTGATQRLSPGLRLAGFAAAATLLVAALVAGWILEQDQRDGGRGGEEQIAAITVGGGSMTDSRFVELATELIEADGRYRREMVEIIQAVEAELPVEMGSAEGPRRGDGLERSLDDPELDPTEASERRESLNLRLF
jgi:hypothetical protein